MDLHYETGLCGNVKYHRVTEGTSKARKAKALVVFNVKIVEP